MSPDPSLLLLQIHLAATWFMAGLIWFVQLLHYPYFAYVGESGFAEYHRRHTERITWLVAPVMGLELATGIALLVLRPGMVPEWMAWAGIALLAIIWCSTFFVQVPAHLRLSKGLNNQELRWLCRTNWVRTASWSVRGIMFTVAVANSGRLQ